MKGLVRKLIEFKLGLIARMYLWRFKPDIVAITGNVGKTSSKEAIACVLSKARRVRYGKGNLNNELGVPLTILGEWADEYYAKSGLFFWTKVILLSFIRWFFESKYPEVLILEFGADRPGDIAKLVKKYRPRVGIITAIGKIPVHVEYFSDPSGVAREKAKLISSLRTAEFAVLNHDDPVVYDMKEKTRAKVMSYGFTEGATVRMSNFDLHLDESNNADGISFKINYGPNTFVPVIVHGVLGKSQALAAGTAVCVGLIYEMNLIEISQALAEYKGPNGRLKVLKGIKNSVIIDDTYNAAPSSTHLALETLKALPAKRKVAILGDMLELGKYSIEAHEEIGNLAAGIADILITVGPRGKFIAYSANNQMESKKIFSFVSSDLAKVKVQEIIKEGDLILVKGSQGARMEKIVEEIMAEPQRKKELLVRQGRKWTKDK